VLEAVPSNHAVILSQHPDCRFLSEAEVAFLEARHSNFVYWPELLRRPGSGQHLVRHVDCVATISGSVGMQALFWGKPLVAMGYNQLELFVSGIGRDGLKSLSSRHISDSTLAWLIFNYSASNTYAALPGRLAAYLEAKLNHWRRLGRQGYFDHPADDVLLIEGCLEDEVQDNLRGHFGAPLGATAVDPVRFELDGLFGDGWFPAERNGDLCYRWTSKRRANLRLPISAGADRVVEIQVGTHAGCDPVQTARLYVGETLLAETEVSTNAPGQLSARVSAEQIRRPATEFWLEASVARPPGPGAQPHGLISTKIAVRPASVNEIRPAHSFDDP
jgi:hypothetical protein